MTSPQENRQNLIALADGFRSAMLVTHDHVGGLKARPMHIAELEDDGTLWFIADVRSGKVDQIAADARVLITMQSSTKQIELVGTARIIDDKAALKARWNSGFDMWFADGPEGDAPVLIQVKATTGRYWDASGLNGLRFAWEATKAAIKDEPIDTDKAGEQGTAHFG